MDISRELAIEILKYLDTHKDFYFPFLVMNQEYTPEDNDFVEIEPSEWRDIQEDENYKTFQLWENLQNLYPDTLELMSKGFLEKITNDSLEKYIDGQAKYYRSYWKENFWDPKKVDEFGFDEFMLGKAEAYEDCLEMLEKIKSADF